MAETDPSSLPIAAILVLSLAGAARADGPALPAANADPAETSVSGLSSGAYMAVQFATAFSASVKGVGVVAGGPFGCARESGGLADLLPGDVVALATALGPCVAATPSPPGVDALYAQAQELDDFGDIDGLDNIVRQKIYLYHGYNDTKVARPVTDAAAAFYRVLLGARGQANLFYQTAIGSGHAQITLDQGGACEANASPYINQCGYDQAGVILQHIYGALEPRNDGTLSGRLLGFDQGRYTLLQPQIDSMAATGFVYMPAACAAGAACRVHVAFHGCLQDSADTGETYPLHAGYNEWADGNRIIVLYPQTAPSPVTPFNPQACWDWWGYHDFSNAYLTRDGRQIAAVHAMVAALTAGHAPAPAEDAQAGPPARVVVADVSDSAAALAWTPVAGAAHYRLYRCHGEAGDFAAVGETDGLSFADAGLSPASDYAWRVTALTGDTESAPSAIATARTRANPPPCARPGSCPVEAGN